LPPPYGSLVRVIFRKMIEERVTTWDAIRGERIHVPGTTMALGRGGLPHDLVQMIVEASVAIDRGFWGSVAAGATFKSTGRKRTKPGQAIIARNRRIIAQAEHVVAEHVYRWEHGLPTPAATSFDELSGHWESLGDGGRLTVEWPSLRVVAVESGRRLDRQLACAR
jgi:hypothetical protein